MDNEKKNQIASVYEELKGIIAAIPADNICFDDDGFSAHANTIIKRIPLVCPEINDVQPYLVVANYSQGRQGDTVDVIPTKAKLNSITGRLKGLYELEVSYMNNGNTFIQNQSQNQTQSLNVVLELHERIISEIPKHTEGTKERGFLEKLKSSLSTVKSITDILSLALKIGGEFGLDPVTIHKLLGL